MQLEVLIYEYRHLGVYDFFFMFSKEFSKEEGQSLIELIVASAIFMVVVSAIAYLVLDTYILDRDASERAQAVFIAEEGLEAVRSIRDNNWNDIPDTDGDGFLDEDEEFMGTLPYNACPATSTVNDEPIDAWPPDFNDDQTVNIFDLALFNPHFGSSEGDPNYDPRYDLDINGSIDILDILPFKEYLGQTCLSGVPFIDRDYCIGLSDGVWGFTNYLPPCPAIGKFNRVINLLAMSPVEKRVISKVSWDFKGGETREINPVSYLTNWRTAPCSGDEPLACNTFSVESACIAFGCDWNPGYCSGTYSASCSAFNGNRALCRSHQGCTWNNWPRTCSGTYTANCGEDFFDQLLCEGQTGCTWNPSVCSGSPNSCDFYDSQAMCEDAGCTWQ